MAAILDLAPTVAQGDAFLGIHPKSIKSGSVDIWAKFDSFGTICPNQSIYCPNSPDYMARS